MTNHKPDCAIYADPAQLTGGGKCDCGTDPMREEFEAWYAQLRVSKDGDHSFRGWMHLTWQAADRARAKRDAEICRTKVGREADYGGRFGGHGNFKGDKTGPECAIAIEKDAGL